MKINIIRIIGIPIFIIVCLIYVIYGFMIADFMNLKNYVEDYWNDRWW
jgi:hypothetical protein